MAILDMAHTFGSQVKVPCLSLPWGSNTKLWTSLDKNLEVRIQNTGPTLAEFDVLNTQVSKAQRDLSEGTNTKTCVVSRIAGTDSQAPLDIPKSFARDNFALPAELSVVPLQCFLLKFLSTLRWNTKFQRQQAYRKLLSTFDFGPYKSTEAGINVVDIVTKLWTGQTESWFGSQTGRKRFVSSPKYANWLWGSPRILYHNCWGPLARE
jgi:hypothetical protein